MKKLVIIFFLFLLFLCSSVYSQAVYEPVYNRDIYFFIDNQASKGNIKIFDAIRPYTRFTIAEKLLLIRREIGFVYIIDCKPGDQKSACNGD